MLDSLFVYGSFSEGMVHFDKIAPYIVEARAAAIVGSSFRLPVGFPVFLQQGFHRVSGQWIRFIQTDVLFPLLDEFHGVSLSDPEKGLFQRLQVDAIDEQSGEALATFVYALNSSRLPKTAKLIEGGDWRRSLAENPALPMRLTERQKAYVRRLAACSGRDIVPIDMTLYRELMHMDLVVDKGRRLALTPLGHDVARFLA